jgi:DNA-binding MarR family transcriptional regulator
MQANVQTMPDDTPSESKLASELGSEDAPMFDLIELLFFAYRDFVADADRLLETFGFGRAHHRVLHFVNRHPGLTIAELLDILKITKQSLNRVLKELLDESYVEQRAGVSDRRQRLLFVTSKGRRLALDLARLQSARFTRGLADLANVTRSDAIEFLLSIIDPTERVKVANLVWRGGDSPAPEGRSSETRIAEPRAKEGRGDEARPHNIHPKEPRVQETCVPETRGQQLRRIR